MRRPFAFIRTTLVGGLLFLVPIVILTAIVAKALNLAATLVRPLAERIPVETMAGVAMAKLLAIAAIVLFCFLTGLLARAAWARKTIRWLEINLLSNIPVYGWIKDVGQSFAGVEKAEGHEPVLAWIEEAWQIGFLLERIDGGHVAVFVPGAPSPWSGAVFFMPEDRIRPLDVPLPAALQCLRRLGLGANALLKGKSLIREP
jgi:uncharacterized membrane protein